MTKYEVVVEFTGGKEKVLSQEKQEEASKAFG